MNKRGFYLASAFAVLLLTGCKLTTTSQATGARIPVHSPESLVELRQAARMLFNNREVIISSNAFARSDRLIIQRQPIRAPDGRLIDSRVDEAPFKLELYLTSEGCFLKNPDTGREVRLLKAACEPL
jgi:hypothetical protein